MPQQRFNLRLNLSLIERHCTRLAHGRLLLFLTAFALLTLHIRAQNLPRKENHRVHGYLLTMAFEWLMVAFIAWGARFGGAIAAHTGGAFAPTGRSRTPRPGHRHRLPAGLRRFRAWHCYRGYGHFIHSDVNKVLQNLLPHTGLEVAVYLFWL